MDIYKDKMLKILLQTLPPSLKEENIADIPNPEANKERKSKKRKKRCALDGCKRKLKLTDMKCRCNSIYCSRHRLPEKHQCSWNPKSESEMESYKHLAGLNNIILFSKMERI